MFSLIPKTISAMLQTLCIMSSQAQVIVMIPFRLDAPLLAPSAAF